MPQRPLTEIQEFPRIWNVVLLALFVLLIFLLPGIDSGHFFGQTIPVLIILVVFWAFVAFIYLKLNISDDGILLRSYPIGFVACDVKKEDIAKVEIKDINALKDFGGWGWRLNPDNISGYIFGGKTGLLITKRSGDRIMISSITSAEVLAEALSLYGFLIEDGIVS